MARNHFFLFAIMAPVQAREADGSTMSVKARPARRPYRLSPRRRRSHCPSPQIMRRHKSCVGSVEVLAEPAVEPKRAFDPAKKKIGFVGVWPCSTSSLREPTCLHRGTGARVAQVVSAEFWTPRGFRHRSLRTRGSSHRSTVCQEARNKLQEMPRLTQEIWAAAAAREAYDVSIREATRSAEAAIREAGRLGRQDSPPVTMPDFYLKIEAERRAAPVWASTNQPFQEVTQRTSSRADNAD